MHILETKNPTISQLIYMKDLFDKEILLNYIVNKYEKNFNYGTVNHEQFHKEIDTLELNIIEVFSLMEDYYLI